MNVMCLGGRVSRERTTSSLAGWQSSAGNIDVQLATLGVSCPSGKPA